MGSTEFFQTARGKTAEEAFWAAVGDAQYDHGHSGYTGTIAEKTGFEMVECPVDYDPRDYAEKLLEDRNSEFSNKWGAAGCIELNDGKTGKNGMKKFLFFGLARS